MSLLKPLIPRKCSGCRKPVPSGVRRIMKKELVKKYGRQGARRQALDKIWCSKCDPQMVDGKCPKCEEAGLKKGDGTRHGKYVSRFCDDHPPEEKPEDGSPE